ncbi:MAG: hypothetical protein KAK00_11120, partial [Nanoarchaeota archaeon]|nr:hypothetical protein [Nanoarchaeota archaeon]
KITERTEILMKMTEGERKILSEQYSWMKQELNLDEPDEDIPPDSEDAEDLSKMNVEQLSAYTAFVKSFMKKHKGANISAAAKAWKKTKKKLSEEALAKKKKYPYPEGVDDKKKYPEKQSVSSESGQKIRQDMSERYTLVEEKEKPIDRFNLSEDQADSNQQFIEFLRKQEGRF